MRVGIVTYDFDPPIGGLGVICKQVKSTLKKLYPGDSYVVLSPSTRSDDRVSKVAMFRWSKPGGCPIFSLILFFKLNFLIRKHKLDLLHVHSGSGGVFLLRKPLCPVVVTAHHTYLQEAEIVFAHSHPKRLWKTFMATLEKRTYAIADSITCVSRDTADFLEHRYCVPRSKITVIENAVHDFCVHDHHKRESQSLLFIGRLEERKGIWTLLKAMEILHLSHPNLRLRLIGRNLLGNSLWNFIEKKNLQKCITVLGHVHDPLMKRELASATMLVVPSLLEGFGLVAADAMASGTCVVVSDAPGLRSIVTHHETGLIFKTGNVMDCSRVIAEAIDRPDLRNRIAEKAKREAMHRFSLQERAKDYHALFERAYRTTFVCKSHILP
ncbi:glycosyltransferase family 1 protein [Candidatus Peribacteria bacterium]|nr:glycosyltransferase family 1 protein [Candidatus Peribacteria bacterium]